MDSAEDIRDKWLLRDRMTHAVTEGDNIRAVVIQGTDLVKDAISRHNLNPLSGLIMGEMLLSALMLTAFLKGEDRVSLRIDSSGSVRGGVAEAIATGEVRGYLFHEAIPRDNLARNELVENAIGIGVLQVTRFLANGKVHTGTVELRRSQLSYDLAYYFMQSEQIPTAVKLDVQFNEDMSLKHAVGLFLQAMPGATEEEIIAVEQNIINHPQIGAELSSSHDPVEVLSRILAPRQFNVLAKKQVNFFCRCSHERFYNHIKLLPLEDLEEMVADGEQKVICQYCKTEYVYSTEDLQKAVAEKS